MKKSVELLRSDLLDLKQLFFTQRQGAFSLQNGEMRNSCIRGCLKWCIKQLKSATTLISKWDVGLHDPDDSKSTQVFKLYSFLWTIWTLKAKKPGLTAQLAAEIDEVDGISVAELLDLISSVVVSEMEAVCKRQKRLVWRDEEEQNRTPLRRSSRISIETSNNSGWTSCEQAMLPIDATR